MSGGHFDYVQFRFTDVIEAIEKMVKTNCEKDEYGDSQNFSRGTLTELINGIEAIRKAQIYVQRIDWLCSGDDSETTFHERLQEDLRELQNL